MTNSSKKQQPHLTQKRLREKGIYVTVEVLNAKRPTFRYVIQNSSNDSWYGVPSKEGWDAVLGQGLKIAEEL